jgi:hypothetical protein
MSLQKYKMLSLKDKIEEKKEVKAQPVQKKAKKK